MLVFPGIPDKLSLRRWSLANPPILPPTGGRAFRPPSFFVHDALFLLPLHAQTFR